MSESSSKSIKRYVYHMKGVSKHTCLAHGPGHSSDECKVLGDFGYKYSKIRPIKDRGNDPQIKINLTDRKVPMILLIMQCMRSSFRKITE